MSAVLMCDVCKRIFSVNSKGWEEFVSRIKPGEENSYNVQVKQRHVCGKCSVGGDDEAEPVAAVGRDDIDRALEIEAARIVSETKTSGEESDD